jgi:hypothetical protein
MSFPNFPGIPVRYDGFAGGFAPNGLGSSSLSEDDGANGRDVPDAEPRPVSVDRFGGEIAAGFAPIGALGFARPKSFAAPDPNEGAGPGRLGGEMRSKSEEGDAPFGLALRDSRSGGTEIQTEGPTDRGSFLGADCGREPAADARGIRAGSSLSLELVETRGFRTDAAGFRDPLGSMLIREGGKRAPDRMGAALSESELVDMA